MTIHKHIVIQKNLFGGLVHVNRVKPFTTLIDFLEPVGFLITQFPVFHSQPITSIKSAAYYMEFHLNMPLWPEHSIKKLKALYIF